ncbi:hypothetical protein KCU93_g511, partial [Aureobasidium melanogenum]
MAISSHLERSSLLKKKYLYVKSLELRKWVLIIKVISPIGGFIRPLMIFKDIIIIDVYTTSSIEASRSLRDA